MQKLTQLPLVSSSSRSLTGADPAGGFSRFAAVSPTFGRLFEGTDPATGGQTAMSRSREEQKVAMSRLREERTTALDLKRLAEKSAAMLQNGWSVRSKPVSFCPCRFRTFRARRPQISHTQRSGGAWSDPDTSLLRACAGLRPTTHTERQRDGSLSCPHLWITMWTAVIVFFVDPRPMQKGARVVDS